MLVERFPQTRDYYSLCRCSRVERDTREQMWGGDTREEKKINTGISAEKEAEIEGRLCQGWVLSTAPWGPCEGRMVF